MSKLVDRAALKRIQDECQALEEQANLSQQMQRAHEGRFMPLGANGESASPDEYFADEHDHFRETTRDAYFSVQNINLRKNLISARRKIEQSITHSHEVDIKSAEDALHIAVAKARKEPWGLAAIVSVAIVAIGYSSFGNVGAIAGAIGGFFLGQGVLSNFKNETAAAYQQAKGELEQAHRDKLLRALWPECFSLSEEIIGDREEHLDRESAYANVLRSKI